MADHHVKERLGFGGFRKNPPIQILVGEVVQQRQLTNLELDMLLLFYTMSDQYGKVDIVRARAFLQQQYGILIPDKPINVTAEQVQSLVNAGILPDVADHLTRISNLKPPMKRRRKKPQDTKDPKQ